MFHNIAETICSMTTPPKTVQPFFTHWEYEKAQDMITILYRKAGTIGLSENENLELDKYIRRSSITLKYLAISKTKMHGNQ